ncbi:tRNA (guanine-N1)-methyltransferase [Croceivirga thetidis]|uniref:tRNA (Guanine-N1)-methyltransferase n=1 Tax=Croceivirga thetidis TaxID=2721623 RepID=A0ABX1GSH0_9FLAO|nr:tRNA (guanine-N1)-methyltransferase [Croceivirga thetidis]NKI32583.1 tRNA (guanine-N1)-methyltransferase [Croceivirga thetidis]
MKRIIFFLAISIAYFGFSQQDSTQNTPSQTKSETTNLENGTVNEQYQYLLKRGGNYSANGIRYEVIRIGELNKFMKNVQDSLSIANKSLLSLRNTIAENTTEIDGLKSQLSETSESLKTLNEEKDSMSFFGVMVSKGAYRGIVWTIILVLLFLLLIFIYKFRNSNFLTVQAKSALANLEDEFEQHRRRALEREQKISRQLQDEINKNRAKK